jgi:predicted DNA-binding transcriptional regulator YafY
MVHRPSHLHLVGPDAPIGNARAIERLTTRSTTSPVVDSVTARLQTFERLLAASALLDPPDATTDDADTVAKSERRRPGLGRAEVKIAVQRLLAEAGSAGLTKAELVERIIEQVGNTTAVSVQRALDDLRELDDAKIECLGKERRWRLIESFGMPLLAPDREDLVAVLVAQAILAPLADADLQARIERLVADVDEQVRRREPEDRRRSLPLAGSVSATLTLGTRIDPTVLRTLLETCRRKVLRIVYDAPWKSVEQGRVTYEIEPWGIRVHDGAAYLRAWRRDVAQARTYRVAQIQEITVVAGHPHGRLPPVGEIWGDSHPAFGIDHDRPGTAVVRLHGAVARWCKHVVWHPEQRDRWIIEGEVLERTLAYRSCRELARRIASVLDGVESIAPESLRAEVEQLVARVPMGEPTLELPAVMYRARPGTPVPPPRSRAADDD